MNTVPVYAQIPGIIRGMLQEGVRVHTGMKCGDIDPRCEREHCYTISDKARAVGGGALEAISRFEHRRNSMGIILLAAGESKRYGSNKLLEMINGRRMFEYAVDAAANTFPDISDAISDNITDSSRHLPEKIIVTGYDEIAEYASEKGFFIVRNDRPELGISESLKLGLLTMTGKMTAEEGDLNAKTGDSSPIGSVMFTVCDQPGLSSDSFNRLRNAYAASDKGLACMGKKADSEQYILGNPCIFSKKYFDELMMLTGDTGGKRVIKAHAEDLKVVTATDFELADIDIKQK